MQEYCVIRDACSESLAATHSQTEWAVSKAYFGITLSHCEPSKTLSSQLFQTWGQLTPRDEYSGILKHVGGQFTREPMPPEATDETSGLSLSRATSRVSLAEQLSGNVWID